MLSVKLVTYAIFCIIFMIILAVSAYWYTPPTGLNTAKPEEWEILLLGYTTPVILRHKNTDTSKGVKGWEWALLSLTATLIFNYRENPYSGSTFLMWEMKAAILAASIPLTLLISPFVNSNMSEIVTAFEVTQSAPLIFEVLAPIGVVIILQNLYRSFLIQKVDLFDESTSEIFGFALACLSSVIIVAATQYLVQINPELTDPVFESIILYIGVLILWIVSR